MIRYAPIALVFSLVIPFVTACSDRSTADTLDIATLPAIDLVATSQVALPEKAVNITFVPNTVAPWMSHIIVQSEDGQLYRTTAQGDPAVEIKGATSQDIFGLKREAAPGIFLSIDPAGRVQAFVEGAEGTFSQLILSSNEPTSLSNYCRGGDPVREQSYAITTEGDLVAFSVGEITNESIEIDFDTPQSNKSRGGACASADGIDKTSNQSSVRLFPASGQISVSTGAGTYRLAIGDGLSVPGLSSAGAVSKTTLAMGSTFNEGLIAIGDSAEPRLVLLALPYVERELQSVSE